jgi:sarcosine oxidase subunit alpha
MPTDNTDPGSRLPAHPSQSHGLSRRAITFEFEGQSIPAYEGDTVAAALFAAGRRIFTRSFKYHRPRGLLCCAGRCPNCMMNVDGAPNVRTCVTPVREGMRVRHQNAWPSLERDALASIGLVERFLPVGFYYKTFIHPRALWPAYEHVLRHVGGLGVVQHGSEPDGYRHEYRTTEVAVIGGGPAGMGAALAAAHSGHRVILVEEQTALGGMLRGDTRIVPDGEAVLSSLSLPSPITFYQVADYLASALEAAGVTVWTGAAAFGAYEGGHLGVLRGKDLIELRYERLILATGAFERPAVFAGNDLPGVMLGTGAQRLMRLYGIRPGRRAVVATSHDGGRELAVELRAAGVEVVAVADTRGTPTRSDETVEHIQVLLLVDASARLLPATYVAKAHGRHHLTHVELTSIDGRTHKLACDLLCLDYGWEPALSLLAQEQPGPLRWDAERSVFAIGEGEEEILAAGSVAGAAGLGHCLALGEAAGRAAAGSWDGAHPGGAESLSGASRLSPSSPSPRDTR